MTVAQQQYCAAVKARFPECFSGRVLEVELDEKDSLDLPSGEPFDAIVVNGMQPGWLHSMQPIERLLKSAGLLLFTNDGELTETDLCWSTDGFRAFINYQFSRNNKTNEFCGWMIKR